MNLDTFLLSQEGKRYVAYLDQFGKGTIGIGHTGPEVVTGLVWNDDQINFAYQLDKAKAWQGCADNLQPWFLQLNEPRQTALISMAFQMGVHGLLEFTQTLANIRDEHYANAAECMRQSAWAKQTPKRAQLEASMIETGNW